MFAFKSLRGSVVWLRWVSGCVLFVLLFARVVVDGVLFVFVG